MIERLCRTVGAEALLEKEKALRIAAALQDLAFLHISNSPVFAKELYKSSGSAGRKYG